jgi:hypothetical protein
LRFLAIVSIPGPHVQAIAAPVRRRHSARNLTDGGGLIVVRRLWDALDLGSMIDRSAQAAGGYFRPSPMVEIWVALLLYGVLVLDDLPCPCWTVEASGVCCSLYSAAGAMNPAFSK